MKFVYPAIFHKEDENSLWVEFPDLEGCQSFGETLEEVFFNAQEALEGYCIVSLEGKQALPAPSNIFAIAAPADGFVNLIECDVAKYLAKSKAVKKTLTIPAWLNDMAVDKQVNFSAVLQEALIECVQLQA